MIPAVWTFSALKEARPGLRLLSKAELNLKIETSQACPLQTWVIRLSFI